MENIILPNTIEFSETDRPNTGRVVITPCHQGYGTTLGNALRRVLLSSLPGAAVENVKVNGVQHEFAAIEGVQEDMIEIILNLKQMAVRLHSQEPVTLSLTKKGKGEVKAGDFDKNSDVDIIDPEMVICTLTDSKKDFDMEVTIGKGRGYVPVSKKETKDLELGTIAIDSLYTPIRDVGYNVDMTRVGDVTNYEKLTVTIETNGTITPKEAIVQATQVLMSHFSLIIDASENGNITAEKAETVEEVDEAPEEEVKEEAETVEEKTEE